MAITDLLATSNAVKLDGVSFSSSFSGKQNHFLARRLSLTTHSHSRVTRVQTNCCYHETSLKAVTPFKSEITSYSDGTGIFRFLKGKSYFVTGATGFLAKVLIEKLLRTSPEIGKIFLMIKSKDQESANKRLYDEIISSELFKVLKQMHGSSYEAFMKSKLIPVTGDIGEDNLGIKPELADKISEEIDVIINCGGRTTFDDRYDSALSVNALGPAYVTGKKEGTVLETPLCIGENISSDLNIETELKLASETVRKSHGRDEAKKLKELGMERAQSYGWENTYTFTKAMGETVIHSKRGDIPVVIMRPSIIESSYKEPFPGWLQGIRMSAPFILAYGKDKISHIWGDYQSSFDVIPVDMVANATIAAMAKHGCGNNVSQLKVYNVTSSSHANPLRAGELVDFARQHLRESPLTEETTKDLERMTFHSSLEGFTSSVSSTIATLERERMKNGEGEAESHTELSRKGKRKLKYIVSLARTYQPYGFFYARFDDSNTRSLIQELSVEERKTFEFDSTCIDWEHYIVNVHLPGLKREFFQERST
ncbi:unnamed protein product [Microthlaspi erraticum]|uniref:Fatty acyl-CoA reductase n=1 Tax=Microthlaspi erraticum TaxID=1685480 RepID=A0A6D2KUD2_9BRAS|nr:unnamed protein product [Microthlaspi erraticum]